MTEAVFYQSVKRAEEEGLTAFLTGQGESLIHPDFDKFVRHLSASKVPFSMTTNAALLTPEKSAFLLDQGISRMTFSVSDLGDDYEEVYNLDVDQMHRHVDAYLALNNGRSEAWVSIVEHDINRDKIPAMREFWEKKGVTGVYVFRQITRGGACQTGHYFLRSEAHRTEAEELMRKKGVSTLCNLAFTAPFVGWNGQYYICCSDYEKVEPLGSVFDYSLSELDDVKKLSIARGNSACLKCNYDPVNVIREAMFEVENGEASRSRIANRLAVLRQQQNENPELYSVLDWQAGLPITPDNAAIIAVQK